MDVWGLRVTCELNALSMQCNLKELSLLLNPGLRFGAGVVCAA